MIYVQLIFMVERRRCARESVFSCFVNTSDWDIGGNLHKLVINSACVLARQEQTGGNRTLRYTGNGGMEL